MYNNAAKLAALHRLKLKKNLAEIIETLINRRRGRVVRAWDTLIMLTLRRAEGREFDPRPVFDLISEHALMISAHPLFSGDPVKKTHHCTVTLRYNAPRYNADRL